MSTKKKDYMANIAQQFSVAINCSIIQYSYLLLAISSHFKASKEYVDGLLESRYEYKLKVKVLEGLTQSSLSNTPLWGSSKGI